MRAVTAARQQQTLRGSILGLLGGASLLACACAPEDETPHQASAEVYAQEFCEQVCDKYDECAPVPDTVRPCVMDGCVADYLDKLQEPCILERTELSRCRLERESCEEYFDTRLDVSPDSACYDWVTISHICTVQMGSPDLTDSNESTQ